MIGCFSILNGVLLKISNKNKIMLQIKMLEAWSSETEKKK